MSREANQAAAPDTGAAPDPAQAGPAVPAQTEGDERITSRAGHLLPEELAVGSDDPRAQADAILADSDLREADQQAAPDSFLERRTSAQTVNPGEPPD